MKHTIPDCPFEILGYFEELLEPESGKVIGYRTVEKPDRPLGSPGRRNIIITETLELRKGTKTVLLKASPDRPKQVTAMIQIRCGRLLYNIKAEKEGTFYPKT